MERTIQKEIMGRVWKLVYGRKNTKSSHGSCTGSSIWKEGYTKKSWVMCGK